jgi:hypothetical protein
MTRPEHKKKRPRSHQLQGRPSKTNQQKESEMFTFSMAPRTSIRPAPARPGIIYTQRSTEFARIMGSARTSGGAK